MPKKQETEFRLDEIQSPWQLSEEDEVAELEVQNTSRPVAWKLLYEMMAILCVAMVITFLFFTVFRPVTVQGSSMVPTLKNEDRLVLYCFRYTPQYGDIVVVRRSEKEPLIKRVIAMEGDTVYIDSETWQVYRNGELLEEGYISSSTPPMDMTGEITVPKGHLFVMGDNRTNSHDSRSKDVGVVSLEDVMGKALVRLYPKFTVFSEE